MTLLELPEVDVASRDGAVLIDGRIPEVFASGHVRGSINVSLDGRFAEYAGDVARADQPIVVIADAGRETEAKVRLARIGFDDVRGALVDVEAVLAAHPEVAETARRFPARRLRLVARRRAGRSGRRCAKSRGASGRCRAWSDVGSPAHVARPIRRARSGRPIVVYCAGGYRSSVAASLLRAHGFDRVADIMGGFDAWHAAGLPVEQREPEPGTADPNGS